MTREECDHQKNEMGREGSSRVASSRAAPTQGIKEQQRAPQQQVLYSRKAQRAKVAQGVEGEPATQTSLRLRPSTFDLCLCFAPLRPCVMPSLRLGTCSRRPVSAPSAGMDTPRASQIEPSRAFYSRADAPPPFASPRVSHRYSCRPHVDGANARGLDGSSIRFSLGRALESATKFTR